MKGAANNPWGIAPQGGSTTLPRYSPAQAKPGGLGKRTEAFLTFLHAHPQIMLGVLIGVGTLAAVKLGRAKSSRTHVKDTALRGLLKP